MDLNLLEKTELWINNIKLDNVNLTQVSEVTAEVLNIPRDKVLVVDVRDTHITLDILQRELESKSVFGKKKELLCRLSHIEGFEIFEDTDIHSAGILGMIGLDEEDAKEVIEKTHKIAVKIEETIAKRVVVFPTGFEVKRGMIEDTNTPFIKNMLTEHGYNVSVGDILDDDLELIAGKLRQATNYGYGIIITTGGVGAEDKDKTVEAILKLDQDAITPYIVKFKKGTGRHEKEGVRIGVGQVGQTLIIALPGPNDEVKIGMGVIMESLKQGTSKEELAHKLVEALRDKWRNKMWQEHHMHDHHGGHK
ncbi:molybdopterin-binding protein [Clostridium magnum]|uniref:Putative competence-damage inducible protein n=1 Tax=Clostridium magnum DSM 2767 TaxID=1121326 RepID=A0A162U7H5_9CLOT|nr:molybdopterin-binding protein [Clostridium magnum]KZL93621.1 putative competence-damage inducible protein [Clostridium magnum DSM 2767]SHI57438.1 molybdenum cofactor synthesis domain-containing protein [Clostridium magnum DSM 2767]